MRGMKNILQAAKVTAVVLLILVGVQLAIGTGVDGQGWNWTFSDFVFAGVFCMALGVTYLFVRGKFVTKNSRLAAGLAVVVVFALIWIHAAVGLPILDKIIPGGS